MAYERTDYDELLKRKLGDRVELQRTTLERVVGTGALMDDLTGRPEWDFFLQAVAEMKEAADALVDQVNEILLGPETDQNTLMSAKIARATAVATSEAYESVMKIPKAIIETAHSAKKVLSS